MILGNDTASLTWYSNYSMGTAGIVNGLRVTATEDGDITNVFAGYYGSTATDIYIGLWSLSGGVATLIDSEGPFNLAATDTEEWIQASFSTHSITDGVEYWIGCHTNDDNAKLISNSSAGGDSFNTTCNDSYSNVVAAGPTFSSGTPNPGAQSGAYKYASAYIEYTASAGGTIVTRTLSDSIDVADELVKLYRELFKLLSDNLELSDLLLVTLTTGIKERLLTDNIEIYDNVYKFLSIFKLLSENVALQDSLNKSVELFRQMSDNISVTDELFVFLGKVLTRVLQDNVNVTDQVLLEIFRNTLRTLGDNIEVTDNILKSLQMIKVLADNLDVTDELLVTLIQSLRVRILSDNIDISDDILTALTTALIAAGIIKTDLEVKNILTGIEIKNIDTDLE